MSKHIGIDFSFNPTPLTDTWRQLWVQLAQQLPDDTFYFFNRKEGLGTEKALHNIQTLFLPLPKWSVWGKQRAHHKMMKQQLNTLRINAWFTAAPSHSIAFSGNSYLYINEPIPLKQLKKAIHTPNHKWLVSDQFISEYLRSQGLTANINIAAIPYSNEIQPMDWTMQTAVKVQYASGMDYLLYAPETFEETTWLNVLRGFSLFKKWQQSSMHLLILLPEDSLAVEGFKEKLNSYKYKSAVTTIAPLSPNALIPLIGASYALITVAKEQNHLQLIWQAAASGIPVITAKLPAAVTLLKEAVLYAEANMPEDIGKQMIALYKDERLRSLLISQSLAAVQHLHPPIVAEQWIGLLKSI